MKERKILVDVDGVCLAWGNAFRKYMAGFGYHEVPGAETKYSLAHRYNTSRKTMDELVREFNKSENILSLEPFEDSLKYITKLVDNGFTFTAITSLSDDPNARKMRIKNLEAVFGFGVFDDVICLPIGSSKYHALEPWENTGLYWIEDKFSNAMDGAGLGLKSILITAPYNKDFETDRIIRVPEKEPWKHIYELISKDDDYELY